MKLPKMKYNKNNLKSLRLKATERDKKLLVGLAVLVLIVLSYYFLYRPLNTIAQKLKTEKTQMDAKVAQAKSDLANEFQISQDYEVALAKTIKNTAGFFPKVYPYKDRYVVMLEGIIGSSGAVAQAITFDDPEVGAVPQQKKNTNLVLLEYPLLSLAKKINAAGTDQAGTTAATESSTETKKDNKADSKTLPADAILRVPATLEIQGSYTQIKAVIAGLEKLNRKIAIEEVTIQKASNENYQKATFSLAFYAVEKVDQGLDPFNAWTIQNSYGKADLFN
jgi:Tfp pilus assembly protein PilO